LSRWSDRALRALSEVAHGVAVVLDADEVVDVPELPGEVAQVRDWWALRTAYERSGRRRDPRSQLLVLLVRGPLAARPLPWDIERAARAKVIVRLPGPPSVRAVLAELANEDADRAINAIRNATEPAMALLRSVTGLALPVPPLMPADQLRLAARIAVQAPRSLNLSALARPWIDDPVVSPLLREPPDAAMLQREWERFAVSPNSEWTDAFRVARVELAQLFGVGVLQPVTARPDVPRWASVGVRSPSDEERAAELLARRPSPFPPIDQTGWCVLAEWWGAVRCLTANGPSELRQQAWNSWAEIDGAFLPWLRAHYGAVLSSASRWPPAVHRIARHLARRLRDGDAERILLIVLDGLGHTQWAHLRDRIPVTTLDAGSAFALVPTYTTVSRQAIFAADLPVTFPDTLWTTAQERRRWQAFWADEGETRVSYQRVRGRLPHDHVDFGSARAVGVVVNAVDDLMHTSELFGDAQLLANLDVWAANGFLLDLTQSADAAGFEVWMTADHGNLECLPAGGIAEGAAIEGAGKRLLRYANRVLRDSSAAKGIVWDDVPGLPVSAESLRFAPRRLAYTNQLLSVSHGGLSLDEVVVPLVRVKP
jgi:hypothetical protein